MKKIIGIIFVSLMFANTGFAEFRLIEYKEIGPNFEGHYDFVTTICVDGYKFVGISSVGKGMVQAFEERDGKSLPAKC